MMSILRSEAPFQQLVAGHVAAICRLVCSIHLITPGWNKDLPNMNTFCDWLSETIVTSVYDSLFRNYNSIVLLRFIL